MDAVPFFPCLLHHRRDLRRLLAPFVFWDEALLAAVPAARAAGERVGRGDKILTLITPSSRTIPFLDLLDKVRVLA